MGGKALLALICWLTVSETLAVVNNLALQDNESAESAPRLYRNVPTGIYAAPYGAYSIHIPFISAPKASASRIIPVKESSVVQNANGYLKDSYGNRFMEAPHAEAFKPPFPQQYIQLQELPAHFAQPLAAAPPSFQYKHATPQIIVGSHYRLPLQGAAPTPINHFGFTQPRVYAESVKSLVPPSTLHNHAQGYSTPQAQRYSSPQTQGYSSAQVHGYPPTQFHGHSTTQVLGHTAPQDHRYPTVQQQPTSNNAAYANTQSHEQYNNLKNEPRFQRLQDAPQEAHVKDESSSPDQQVIHNEKTELKAAPARQTVTTVVNGLKTVVNLETNPLPLLDISLLEPLTFANPLVPQVQHFLPRISEATYYKLPNSDEVKNYQKEFVVQNTKIYDNGNIKGKTKKVAPTKKPKTPHHEDETTHQKDGSQTPINPTITFQGTPNESPEFSYEINSPNYKETYKEQAVMYNKETQSEPVHYTYGTKSMKEPVHYSYVHSSEEPIHIKEVRYHGNGEGPKQLIYNFKPEEQNREEKPRHSPHAESEDAGESSEHSEEEGPAHHHNVEHHEHHEESPKLNNHHRPEHKEEEYRHIPNQGTHHNNVHQQHHEGAPKSTHHHRPEHREEAYHHRTNKPNSGAHHNVHNNVHRNHHTPNVQYYIQQTSEPFHPVAQYEEDIRLTAPIKVDPNQHVHHGHSTQPQPHPSSAPQQHPHPTPATQHHSTPHSTPHYAPPAHVQEKSKGVIIQEEAPVEMRSFGEQMMTEMFGKEEDNEKDFEQAYENSAFGFPAYNKALDSEKDTYNPENYGVPREHNDYDINHTPFQQYQEAGDDFPKTTRLSYKDERDNTKEDYFLDYSISKPEIMTDHYKKKVDYYKLYKKQKPEIHFAHDGDRRNKDKQNDKYTAVPSYEYRPVPEQKSKQLFAHYKTAPHVYEYDYSKGDPRGDNSAHASRPFQRYKGKTHFVEPQFQYGFEPITLPRLLDSELAAMASNVSPESEKPGMRKKIYKENWYIKKTSMSDGDPAS